EGAAPFYQSYKDNFAERHTVKAHTVATAIKIGNPASYVKARRTLQWTDGIVEIVSDQEILDAKAQVDLSGIGCEPASAASVAGVRKLIASGVIKPSDDVVAGLASPVLHKPPTFISCYP